MTSFLNNFLSSLRDKKNVDIVLVSIPKKPMPIIINITAIILPRAVVGEMSPYPTVEVVTKAHHNAFEKFMFSTCEIAKAPRITVEKVIRSI